MDTEILCLKIKTLTPRTAAEEPNVQMSIEGSGDGAHFCFSPVKKSPPIVVRNRYYHTTESQADVVIPELNVPGVADTV